MASAWRIPDLGHSRRALANSADARYIAKLFFDSNASSHNSGFSGSSTGHA